ncbi:MAG: alginate export family protein, partial [Thiohalophilus sp.]|uniref:alginate export family protein n=1 Tax=Thiohalophilus sp. TaxID=3028392 RepID=UPI0028706A36
YESVEQNNALRDASALTLRSRISYATNEYKGLSATLGMEDVRIMGENEYSVPVTSYNSGVYSVIADPEVTELDQGFIRYASGMAEVKYGRQVITHDNQRFVGHVGWRQDRQTYDGLRVAVTPVDNLKVDYSYITKRNRIFAEAADVDSKDSLLNLSYKSSLGKLSGYAYLLELDNNTDNALDTYGLRLVGSTGENDQYSYSLEYASQESKSGATEYDADYVLAEGAMKLSGMTFKLGYELLGSDNGTYGFSTPLATVHAFNGWTDQFLTTPDQGLVDLYVSLGGKIAGGKWLAVYHDFSADESTATIDDLGDEINVLYAKKFGKVYTAGIKYGAYSAGDAAAGKVDTDKLWVWGEMKF